MNLNIKIGILLIFCGSVLFAQEPEQHKKKGIENRDFGIYLELNGMIPAYYGNNFMAKAYSVSPGINFGFTTQFYEGFSFHLNGGIIEAVVEKPELVGTIATTTITRVSFGTGYSLTIFDRFTFIPSAHLGYVKYGHRLTNSLRDGDGKTRDDGTFLGIRAQLNYPLFEWLELTAGAQNNFDFLATQTAPEDESFFSNALSIVPSVGLRIKVSGRRNN